MNDHGDQLSEAFRAHENQTPDPAEVYARVQELAGKYRRRRWGAQAAGGAVLGAGLIAGSLALQGALPGPAPTNGPGVVAPAAAPASPSPAVSAAPPAPAGEGTPTDEEAWEAYFAAGYDYDDAVALSKIWQSKDEIGDIKADAGRLLLDGKKLPLKPRPENVADAKEAARVDAFFKAGYTVDDAVELARLWKKDDAYAAKVEGGKRLLDGKKLPIEPSPEAATAMNEAKLVNAFFDKGYDYDDAVKLAEMWKLDEPYQAKIEGGKRILAGDALPIRP